MKGATVYWRDFREACSPGQAAGFSFFIAWVLLLTVTPVLQSLIVEEGQGFWRPIALVAIMVVFAVEALRNDVRPRLGDSALTLPGGLLASGGTLLVVLGQMPEVSTSASTLAVVSGAVLLALGLGTLVLGWARIAATLRLRGRVVLTASSALLGTLIALGVLSLPPFPSALLAALTPLFSMFFLDRASSVSRAVPIVSLTSGHRHVIPGNLFAVVLAFGAEFTLMAHILADSTWDATDAPGISALLCFFCAIAVVTLYMSNHTGYESPVVAFEPAIPLCAAGVSAVPFLGAGAATVALGVSFAGLGTFVVYLWIVLGNITVTHGMKAESIYSKGLAVFLVGMLLGEGVAYALRTFSGSYPMRIALVALFGLVLALWLGVRGDIFADEPVEARDTVRHAGGVEGISPVPVGGANAVGRTRPRQGDDVHFGVFCACYGVSVREADVLWLWLHGRNTPYICDELFIAKSTVQTHLKHLYMKTGVTSRQELIDLYETASVTSGSSDTEATGLL